MSHIRAYSQYIARYGSACRQGGWMCPRLVLVVPSRYTGWGHAYGLRAVVWWSLHVGTCAIPFLCI